MGPFNRKEIIYKHKKTVWTGGLLIEEKGYDIMQALAQCGVLMAIQAITLAGCGKYSKNVFPVMVKKGYLDCYESEKHIPKLYSLSKKGAEILKTRYRVWDTNSLIRLAVANQFWIKIKGIWVTAKWDTSGETPILENKGIRFTIFTPRKGHMDRLYTLRQLNLESGK